MKRLNVLKKKISFLILIILFIQIVGTAEAFIGNDVYAENDMQIVDTEYNALLSELQSILNEKNFGNEINEIIIDGMRSLWDSYDNIYFSYSSIGYPNKEQYIRDNYIRGINEVSDVRLMSDEEIAFQPGVVAYVGNDEDGNPYMCLKFKPSDESEYKGYLNTLQHEVKHIIQNENWNEKPEEYLYMLRASAEGWAVLGEMNKYRNNNAEDIVAYFNESKIDEENNYLKIGGIGSTTEYSLLPNAILKLTIIVGYDNMYKFETGKITYEDLLSIIHEKLGNEIAERFINDLETAFLNYDRDYSIPGFEAFWFNDDVDFNKIFDAENIVLDVLKNKILNANSKEEIQSLFNFYYLYKKYYCVEYQEIIETVIDENENGISIDRKATDKSNEKINIDSIENVLIDKVIQYKAINKISENERLNKMAIKSLLSNDTGSQYAGSVCLKNEKYVYTETEEDGILIGSLITDGVEAKFTANDILSFSWNTLNFENEYNTEDKLMEYKEVEEKYIKEVQILKNPTKTEYTQNEEELDLSGGILQIIYNDDSKEELSLTNTNIKITGFDNTKIGNNQITVEYQNKKTTFIVSIISKNEKEDDNTGGKINPIDNVIENWTDISNIKIKIEDNKIIVENLSKKENHYYYFWIVEDENDLLSEGTSFSGLTSGQANSISLVNIGDDISYWLDMDIKNVKCQLVEEDNEQGGITKVIINNTSLDELINGKKVEEPKDEKDKEQKEVEPKKENDIFTYKIIEGANQTYKGNGNLTIKSNGDIKKFVKLEIDNKDVSKEYYTMKSGSTIIELKETFVAKLDEGKHEITFVYSDGEVSTTFEVKKQTNDGTEAKTSLPQTGDKIGIVLIITIVSAGIFALTTKHKRKKL